MTVGCWNLHVGVVICVVVERRWCPGTGVGAGGAVCPLKLAYGGEGGIGVMGITFKVDKFFNLFTTFGGFKSPFEFRFSIGFFWL